MSSATVPSMSTGTEAATERSNTSILSVKLFPRDWKFGRDEANVR
jgi:hypothetical protein